ncbi:MAG: GNAT family N-acetyltransferase, partial [Anaerolineales bacterium]|nr:GNAT family N-acetyltransferase [Anaerolineales bacterium]
MGVDDNFDSNLLKDLGDGLVLRQATPDDAEALAEFNGKIHSDEGPDQPFEGVAVWTRDLLERPHPTFKPSDFTIVEDVSNGKIVSSLNLISQSWSYSGIEFGVGRSELVGTHPDYRGRGLVRFQYEVIHGWSAMRGEMVQAITGIPYFYRKFDYEMTLNLGGGRAGYLPDVPKLKQDEDEP